MRDVADRLVRLYLAEPVARPWLRMHVIHRAVRETDPQVRLTLSEIADRMAEHADAPPPTLEP